MKKRSQGWLILISGLLLAMTSPAVRAQDQSQSGQTSSGQGAPGQNAPDKSKEKKKGGFFSGLKAVSGQGSEQKELTATAGSKTVGEGEDIGKIQPSPADRAAVSAMENYSLPDGDVKKFQADGKLKTGK